MEMAMIMVIIISIIQTLLPKICGHALSQVCYTESASRHLLFPSSLSLLSPSHHQLATDLAPNGVCFCSLYL